MHLRGILIAAALAFGAVLAGCETMSAEECAAADWRHLGFVDASSSGADRLGTRAQSCGEKGFTADGGAYGAGFAEGMYQFCQPANGFRHALAGGSFNGSCPAELQRDFYAAYADGQRAYGAQSELNEARNRLSTLDANEREATERIRSGEDSLRRATTDEERTRLRREIEDWRNRRRDAERERRDLDPRVYYLQRRLDDLHYEIGDKWAPW